MILRSHVQYFREIFALPDFLASPTLCFGVQDIEAGVDFEGQSYAELGQLLSARGITASSLDLYDPRASLHHDMNLPVPASHYGRYKTFIDIGSLEHVFDTRQCLENCFRMITPGGHYMLHTPVNGYYAHGLHVFNPFALVGVLELNGFRVIYQKYSTEDGKPVSDPAVGGHILIWLVAAKEKEVRVFRSPQQDGWKLVYQRPPAPPPRFEMRFLPRAEVLISIYLPQSYPLGRYECALMTTKKVPLAKRAVRAGMSEGMRMLQLRLNLSGYRIGEYLLAIRNGESGWTYFKFCLFREISVRWLKL